MSMSPLSVSSSASARRPHAPRAAALFATVGLLLGGSSALADTATAPPLAGEAGAEVDTHAIAADIAARLSGLDRAIRSGNDTSAQVARQAMSEGFGPLATRQDDRMTADTTALLAGAPSAAHARFTLDAGTTRSSAIVQMAASASATARPARVDTAPPARRRR